MSEKYYAIGFAVFLAVLETLQMLYINRISRRGVYFGVRFPEDISDDSEFKAMMLSFKRFIIFMGLLYIPAIALLYNRPNVLLGVSVGLALIQQCSFCFYNVKMKAFKRDKKYDESPVRVDMNVSAHKLEGVHLSYYIIPVAVIAATLAILLMNFDKLPEMIPIHWGFDGADGFIKKNALNSFFIIFMQLFLLVVFIFVNISMLYMKQDVRSMSNDAFVGLKKVRRAWTVYCIMSATLMLISFAIMQMFTLGLINATNSIINKVMLVPTVVIVVGSLYVGIKYGTTGEWLKKNAKVEYSNDDTHWYFFGTLYFNREDPAIFIPKRVGIGSTINFGNPLAILLLVGLIAGLNLIMYFVSR